MKQNLLAAGCLALSLSLGTAVMSCSGNSGKSESQKATPAAQKSTAKGELPNYRYVDLDTLLSKYNLAKDYNEEMMRLQSNLESTARQKESSIRNFESAVQKKMQNNGYLTEASLKQDQQKYVSMQNAAQNELSKMQNNFQNAAMEAQKTVNDSVEAFIKEYNVKKGYDAIFFKAATLYIDPRLDITSEVVEGLNARYNKVKK